jgi:PAS domain S-box-containing protein
MTEVASDERVFGALDHVPTGVFVLSADLTVRFWNRTLEEWTRLSRAELLGTNISQRFPHFGEPKYAERLRHVFQGGAPVIFSAQLHQQIIPSFLRNGTPRIQHSTVTAIPDPEGDRYCAIFTLQDVTDLTARIDGYWEMHDRANREAAERRRAQEKLQLAYDHLEHRVEERTAELLLANQKLRNEALERKQAEEKLRQAERLASIGTLAAGIAHEINNPLSIVLMNSTALLRSLEKSGASESAKQYVHEINGESKRCARIIDCVLAFARQQDSAREPHDVSAVARRAVEVARREIPDRQVVLVPLGYRLTVHLQAAQIEQALVNLLLNAMQASPAGAEVTLRIRAEQQVIQFVVEDQGQGMTKEEVSHAFDPFFTTRREAGGVGLGLSLVHGIVTKHNGSIDVRSESGRGTTVTVSLPTDGASQGT